MEIIAHRGAPKEALENSFASFDLAIKHGVQRIELDIHLSRDQQIIVMHDESLARTAEDSRNICDLSVQQLRGIRLKNGEKIPFLEEVISRYLPKVELNIEIKSGGKSLVNSLINLLGPIPQRPNRVIISSFDTELLSYISQQHQDEVIAVLWDTPSWHELPMVMTSCQSNILHPDLVLLDSKLMQLAKKNSWQVFPYISLNEERNCEAVWQKAWDMRIDGLCTNYPMEFKYWLEKKKV